MRSMRWALIGVVAVLVSCGGGSSSTTSVASSAVSEVSSTTSESSTSTVTEIEVAYRVGDTGPGGGIIVYADEEGFNNSGGDNESIGAMCVTGTCHYLEMTPIDLEGWYSWEDAIVASEAFSTASANDWKLPSKDALNEMCKYAFSDTRNRICNDAGNSRFTNSVGGFLRDFYWGSSEVDINYAWIQSFNYGAQSNSFKYITGYVRPMRAF